MLESGPRSDGFGGVCSLPHKYEWALLTKKVNRSSFRIPATYEAD